MSATTVIGQVRDNQPSTHATRNAAIALTVIALFALSFFVGRATASSHVSSATTSVQAGTHPQLSPADRAIIAGDDAALSNVGTTEQLTPADRAQVEADVIGRGVAGTTEQLSPANRALIEGDVAPLSNAGTSTQLSSANRAEIANDVAPVTSRFGQANTASCRVGRPC